MNQLTDYEKALIKAYGEAVKTVKIYTSEGEQKLKGLAEDAYSLGFHDGFKAATERLQAKNAAYYDYVSGKINLSQLEAVLVRQSIYQQSPVEEWIEPRKGES